MSNIATTIIISIARATAVFNDFSSHINTADNFTLPLFQSGIFACPSNREILNAKSPLLRYEENTK